MLTEGVRLDRHAGVDDGGDVAGDSSRGRFVGVAGSGDEDGEVIGDEAFCSAPHLWEGDRRSKSGVRWPGMMSEERLDPGRSARSSVAE